VTRFNVPIVCGFADPRKPSTRLSLQRFFNVCWCWIRRLQSGIHARPRPQFLGASYQQLGCPLPCACTSGEGHTALGAQSSYGFPAQACVLGMQTSAIASATAALAARYGLGANEKSSLKQLAAHSGPQVSRRRICRAMVAC